MRDVVVEDVQLHLYHRII